MVEGGAGWCGVVHEDVVVRFTRMVQGVSEMVMSVDMCVKYIVCERTRLNRQGETKK